MAPTDWCRGGGLGAGELMPRENLGSRPACLEAMGTREGRGSKCRCPTVLSVSRTAPFRRWHASEFLQGVARHSFLGPIRRVSDSVSLGQGPRRRLSENAGVMLTHSWRGPFLGTTSPEPWGSCCSSPFQEEKGRLWAKGTLFEVHDVLVENHGGTRTTHRWLRSVRSSRP